jgi:hypothetical protein
MRCMRGLMLYILLFIVTVLHAQPHTPADAYLSSALAKMKLKNAGNGKPVGLDMSGNRNFTVFVFLSPECPLSQQYTLPLNEMAKSYQQQVSVIGIFPGKSYDQQTINSFLKKYKIRFTTYIDESKGLSNYLKATVTPEVILLSREDDKLTVRYRGAIDDRVKSLGVKRLKASNYFLQDAVEQSLRHKDVVIKRTDPVGCLINDY